MPSLVTTDASSSAKQNRSVEPLWTLRRAGQSVRAELRRTEQGWEVYLFSRIQWFAAHRVASRELALRFADEIYDGLLAEGWVLASKAIHASWGSSKNV
jgi:hypothetical protein